MISLLELAREYKIYRIKLHTDLRIYHQLYRSPIDAPAIVCSILISFVDKYLHVQKMGSSNYNCVKIRFLTLKHNSDTQNIQDLVLSSFLSVSAQRDPEKDRPFNQF